MSPRCFYTSVAYGFKCLCMTCSRSSLIAACNIVFIHCTDIAHIKEIFIFCLVYFYDTVCGTLWHCLGHLAALFESLNHIIRLILVFNKFLTLKMQLQ